MRAVADGAYANLELPKVLRNKRIDGRDAAFATELVYGATRMRGLYDRVVEVAAQRSLAEIDGPVLDTLRLGVHQLLGMRVATHAAVDETVALARQVNGIGASGFVNAVLRRVAERDREAWLEVVTPEDPSAALAVRTSHPEWVVRTLRQALLGHGAATPEDVDGRLLALLDADNAPPRVTLAARPGLATSDELRVDGATPGLLARTALILEHGDPGAIRAVREGRAAVQDEGSQLVALALAAAPVEAGSGEGGAGRERWLDLCAGPGGKAGLLAALALERDADLVANEVNPNRADLVRQTLAAAIERGRPGQVTVRTGDGREVGANESDAYDRVLVDAPCTGLGALRRRPEARWRRQPSDVPGLAALQRELLTSALDATRPGGVVAYATCSPHLVETRFVVADVLKRRPDVEALDAATVLVDREGRPIEGIGDAPYGQLWPDIHDTDGMFLALLGRRP
jgi:16S rRNA (cytosine967-C5)-methyltransferase